MEDVFAWLKDQQITEKWQERLKVMEDCFRELPEKLHRVCQLYTSFVAAGTEPNALPQIGSPPPRNLNGIPGGRLSDLLYHPDSRLAPQRVTSACVSCCAGGDLPGWLNKAETLAG
jgi:hypothetical protein